MHHDARTDSEPTVVHETAAATLGILWTVLAVAVGIAIGSRHTAGLAIRDYEDAVYYQSIADTLSQELQRCSSALFAAVHAGEAAQMTLLAYLGERVVIETSEVSP